MKPAGHEHLTIVKRGSDLYVCNIKLNDVDAKNLAHPHFVETFLQLDNAFKFKLHNLKLCTTP